MPDFLSRLVGRTFSLVPVAQPVTRSVFSPESRVGNDYMQALSPGSESVSSNANAGIDGFQDNSIIRQHSELSLNRKKLLNRDGSKDDSRPQKQIQNPDSQSDLISTFEPSYNVFQHNIYQHNIKPWKNNSDFPEQVESISSHHMNEQYNRHLHTQPEELIQDNKSIDNTGHNTFESAIFEPDTFGLVEPDLFYDKNPDNGRILRPDKKSMFNEEQFHHEEQDFQGYTESFENNSADFPDKKLIEYESSVLGSKDLTNKDLPNKVLSNLKSSKAIFQNNEQVSRADFRSGFSIPGDSYPGTQLPSTIRSRWNLKQMSGQKADVPLKNMGSMLLEQNAVAVRPPSTEPTIKVTIGRIEVRAVKPLPEPQLQAPPKQQPILSLDDYLKQYNG